MIRRKISLEILLIGLATVMFLLAAFGLYLLSDMQSPLSRPVAFTTSPLPLTTSTQPIDSRTRLPTRTPRTSYTPFATRLTLQVELTQQLTLTESTPASPTISPDPRTPSPTSPAGTPYPGVQSSPTSLFQSGTPSPTGTATSTPTFGPTTTLASGEFGISGRIVLNGVPVPGVSVSFRDDQPSRSTVTDAQGRYWFTTYAIGIDFLLSFEQSANPNYSPTSPTASTALLFGYLPTGSNIITLPDLEISLVIAGLSFELTTPLDGATYNATNITTANPIQFVWTTYSQAEYYYVELIDSNTDELLWGSENVTSTNVMFGGTLDDGSHIGSGTYDWFVAANRPLNSYEITIYTQPRSIVINP